MAEANLAVVAVPSAAFGATVAALPGTCPILSLTKGLDPGHRATGSRLWSTNRPVAVLSGPNIADEISRGLPAAAVIAGEDSALSVQLQLAITSPTFRVYVNDDVVGVELCAVVAVTRAGRRRRPAAPAARARARCRPRTRRARTVSKQKNPPLTQCSLRGFSLEAAHHPVAVELRRRRTAGAAGPPSSSPRRRAPEWWASSASRSMSATPSAYVAQNVAVAQHRRGTVQTPAGGGVLPGVQASDLDAGGPHPAADETLDLFAPVAGQQQEAVEALRDVDLDDVPDDRAAADLHQRLGDRLGVFLQPGSPASAEDRDRRLSGAVHAADYPIRGPAGSIRARWARIANPEIFKAYDIRGLYGERHRRGRRRADRTRVRAGDRRAGRTSRHRSCGSGSAATCA